MGILVAVAIRYSKSLKAAQKVMDIRIGYENLLSVQGGTVRGATSINTQILRASNLRWNPPLDSS